MPQYLSVVDWVSMICNMIVAVSAVVVAILGVYGIRQWRREMKGRAKFDLARKMAILAFNYDEQFDYARNPVTFAVEAASRSPVKGETEEQAQILNEYHARLTRLHPLRETLIRLREASWEAEIVFGESIDALVLPIQDSYTELSRSIRGYFDVSLEEARLGRSFMPSELKSKARDMIYGVSDDTTGKDVDAVIKRLTDYLHKVIT